MYSCKDLGKFYFSKKNPQTYGIFLDEYTNLDRFLLNSPNQRDNFHDLLINSLLLRVQPARERILTFMALILVLIKISRLP
jgi:hypothetical protein